MLLVIAFAFILLKIAGFVQLTWNEVILCELILLMCSILELILIYKKINKSLVEWSFFRT